MTYIYNFILKVLRLSSVIFCFYFPVGKVLFVLYFQAPAAFGLVTFLMHEGLDRVRIRKHLLIFALAAPVLAIVTYFGISQVWTYSLNPFNCICICLNFTLEEQLVNKINLINKIRNLQIFLSIHLNTQINLKTITKWSVLLKINSYIMLRVLD